MTPVGFLYRSCKEWVHSIATSLSSFLKLVRRQLTLDATYFGIDALGSLTLLHENGREIVQVCTIAFALVPSVFWGGLSAPIWPSRDTNLVCGLVRWRFLQAGALPLLVQALIDGNQWLKEAAARTLKNISFFQDLREGARAEC